MTMETQTLKFTELPFTFQRAIVIYNGENGTVDWTVIPAWAEANKVNWFDEKNVQVWIDDYAKVYANQEFEIGEVDTEELKIQIMQHPDIGYDTFQEYHNWYFDGLSITDHGDSVFPIIFSGCEEIIEDGWHRFHSYVHKGLKKIPYVKYL